LPKQFAPDGHDLIPRMASTHQKMATLVDAVRDGQWQTSAGQPVRDVIHLGIGGSDTGPQLLIAALSTAQSASTLKLQAHFLANLDHHAVEQTLARCDPAATLVVMASKSDRRYSSA
jgi:glucose-6-phosphate isomerase